MAAVVDLPSVSAQVVGNAFAQQYYTVLYHSLDRVYRFYKDVSKLSLPEEDGSMTITTSMHAINKKIVAFYYGNARAVIKSVDAQESFEEGVQVLVTGSLTGRDNAVRNFSQVFFLAPQDRGYFVLNDMFRFVDDVTDDVPPVAAEPAPAEDQKKKKKKTKKKKAPDEDNQGQLEALSSNDPRNLSKISESRESHPLTGTGNSKQESSQPLTGTENSKRESSESLTGTGNSKQESYQPLTGTGNSKLESSQVWEHLFQMPKHESAVHESRTTWSSIVKNFEPLNNEQQCLIEAGGDDEYRAQQRQDSIKSYQKVAFVVIRSKSAREVDERDSLNIFAKKNESMRNMITFDLHDQNVTQAMKLLKIHLLFGVYVRSVLSFKVITGRGKHSAGKSKVKNSVIDLLNKEGIKWWEEKNNPGVLHIELEEQTNFSFLHSGSGSDSDTD